MCEQEAGLHYGRGCDDVTYVRLAKQEDVSRERQQSRCAAEASAGRPVGAAESRKVTTTNDLKTTSYRWRNSRFNCNPTLRTPCSDLKVRETLLCEFVSILPKRHFNSIFVPVALKIRSQTRHLSHIRSQNLEQIKRSPKQVIILPASKINLF